MPVKMLKGHQAGDSGAWWWTWRGEVSSSVGWQWCESKERGEGEEKSPGHVVVSYMTKDDGCSFRERVELTQTRPHLGGRRLWWVCPACERRCGVVFVLGERGLACRQCADLTYISSQSGQLERAQRQKAKLGKLLGDSEARGGCFDRVPLVKPKWMRQKRFERLVERWRYYDGRATYFWVRSVERLVGEKL